MQTEPDEKLSISRQIIGQHVQADIGAVEVERASSRAVVEDHVEAAGHGDDELVQLLVRVAAALGPPGTS